MASQTYNRILTGQQGEDSATQYLTENGYTILCRNYRYKRAEIDIIAQKPDLLVFVEVKTRTTAKYGHPEEAVSRRKEELFLEAAAAYIEEINWQHDVRFDIISITLTDKQVLHHIEDAFH
ncbi:YraN family protein [Pontibacter arcticus]|uniref:UPF0102 protein DP923_04980 n=1 Tax=Pontibacter arcticus TaxID=2080288 RepID=A0A364RJE4_9BACT|nr:YraN family protein [Pontibacter arcticus]RAU84395.1 YraN family protein [Pontibacter arcticus]